MFARKIKYNKKPYSDFNISAIDGNLKSNKLHNPHLFIEKDKTRAISALPVKSGNAFFLIDIEYIEIILPKREKFHNDVFPQFITGVIAYENTLLPCVNPSQLCRFNSSDESNCFVIISNENFRFALECDFVRFPVKQRITHKQDELLFHKTKCYEKDYYFLNVEILLDLVKELENE